MFSCCVLLIWHRCLRCGASPLQMRQHCSRESGAPQTASLMPKPGQTQQALPKSVPATKFTKADFLKLSSASGERAMRVRTTFETSHDGP